MAASSKTKGGAPSWTVGAAIAALVLIAGFIAWKSLASGPIDTRAPKVLAPGSYDLRKEIQKVQAREQPKKDADKPMGGF